MEQNDIIEQINTACNILDNLRARLINESRSTKKKKTKKITEEITKPLTDMGELNQGLTIKQCLERYGQPTDDEHIQSINNIINKNGISLEQLDSCLERVKYANDKAPKNDIKKYTYSCLHKINSTKEDF